NSRGFPTDFPVVGCERPNVLESRIIARELREQAVPIEPCGPRLRIVRVAGFAGGLLQRRCPITANCHQKRRLVENLATNHFLPEPLLERILRVGLQARDYALSTVCGVWRARWRRRPPYMPPSMWWLRWPAGYR